MPTFGIIAEGPTDQAVLENILLGYFEDLDEPPNINFVQPPHPWEENPGGWSRVFKCLERRDHEGALQHNNFLVIHIDTDVQEEAGFGVPRQEKGVELDVPTRIERVIARLKRDMSEQFLTNHGHRVIFAIAVDSIECWLLPLLVDKKKAKKITGCLAAANAALRKADAEGLGTDEKKFVRAYDDASADYRKRKHLVPKSKLNPSFELFIGALDGAFPNTGDNGQLNN